MLKVKDTKQCLFCKKEIKEFDYHGKEFPILSLLKVIGAGKRRAKCPHCASKDRERLIYHFLNENNLVQNNTAFSLLHIAPEKNLGIEMKKKNIRYVSGDINNQKAELEVDIQNMPFKNEEFDAIICSHVMEHVKDDEKGLQEIYRILKNGAWAILQVPIAKNINETIENETITSPKEKEIYFGQHNHLRIYSEKSYIEKLKIAGFTVETHAYDKKKDALFVKKYCIQPKEKIYFCRKI